MTHGKTPFEAMLSRLKINPSGECAGTLAGFAFAMLEGEAFDLSRIDFLTPPDQDLCLELFGYCMDQGMSEEDRGKQAENIAPYYYMHQPGSRH